MQGVIVKALSGFYYVKTVSETVECRARGRFRLDGSSPLVGDRVRYRWTQTAKGAWISSCRGEISLSARLWRILICSSRWPLR